MPRLIQLHHATQPDTRRVALVDDPHVQLLEGIESVYDLAQAAIAQRTPLSTLAQSRATGDRLPYDPIYVRRPDAIWRLLPPIDHPREPSRCLVSGTGLTHIGSARDRHAMHEQSSPASPGAAAAAA